MKKSVAFLMTTLLCLSLAGCGKQVNDVYEEQSSEVTQEETESVYSSETDYEYDEMDDESSEAPVEFEIPVQTDFTVVDGLSDKYVDFDNRAFAYNGKVFKLGESTFKDLIDGGIPFDENELNNKGNNVNKNYETGTYTAQINDYAFMQFKFVNITDESQTEEECLLSYVRYCYTFVPQPDYEPNMNAEVTECMFDAAKKVCFSFPATLTKEQLLENCSEGAVQDEYNNVEYDIDSEVYMGDSGYHFKFNKTTNQLENVSISWLP